MLNVGENIPEIVHFVDRKATVEGLENESQGKNLSEALENQLPLNRMVAGFSNENVELERSINSIPYSVHEGG